MDKGLGVGWVIIAGLGISGCFPDPDTLPDDTHTSDVDADDGGADLASGETAAGECTTADDCGALAAPCVKVVCLAKTCATQPDPGASCDDGNPCTKDDVCAGTTCGGSPYTCDDGVACTEDHCDGEGGCTYPAAAGFCHIGGLCVEAGEAMAEDPCRICTGGESWSPNSGAVCDDGDACTTTDICDGTQCVGSDRPSDAATDWAQQPLATIAPSTSNVVGLIRAGDDPLFVAQSVGGVDVQLASGGRTYPGAAVQVLRRTAAGLTAYFGAFGLELARVVPGASRDSGNGRVGFGFRYRGTGTVNAVGALSAAIDGDGYEVVLIQAFPAQMLFRSSFPHVTMTSTTAGGLVVLSEFSDTFSRPDVEDTIEVQSSLGSPELAITSLSASGFTNWLAHVGSDGRLQSASICASAGGAVHMTVAHADALTINDARGGRHVVAGDGADVLTTLVTLGSNGEWVGTATIANHGPVPTGNAWPGVGAIMLDCDDVETLLAVPGAARGTSLPLEMPAFDGADYTLVRVSASGLQSPAPIVLADATPFAVTRPRDGLRWLAVTATKDAAWVAADAPSEPIGHDRPDALVTLLGFDGGFALRHVHTAMAGGTATISGVVVSGDGTLVLGGSTLFGEVTFQGADGPLPLPQAADVVGFVLGLNSNGGLQCLPRSE